MDRHDEVKTLFELLSERPDAEELDVTLQYSVTRTGDGQTNPDE
jgi:hypothetical protein